MSGSMKSENIQSLPLRGFLFNSNYSTMTILNKFAVSALLLCCFLLASCSKETSYESRLKGTWVSFSYKNNGNEISAQKQDELTLKGNNNYERTVVTRQPLTLEVVSSIDSDGKWTADEATSRLVLDASETLTVVSLSENALIVRFSENSIPVEIEYRK